MIGAACSLSGKLGIALPADLASPAEESPKAGSHGNEHPRARLGNRKDGSGIRRLAAAARKLRQCFCGAEMQGYVIGRLAHSF
jgi:hypothetical protein